MSDILKSLGYLASASRFRRISDKLQQDGDKIYQQAGIQFKASWFSVYYTLAKSEAPLTITDIASQIEFTHITVKNIVRELVQNNLVEVRPNPHDGRSKIVSLTTTGKELLERLTPIWLSFSKTLEATFKTGNPDILNILDRIDHEINRNPINEKIHRLSEPLITVVDYKPSMKQHFYDLAAPWLFGVLGGTLESDDEYTLNNPDKAYLETGGFLFYALCDKEVIGCVALKRLNEDTFEFAKLFIDPNYRNLGIATKLIARCISRCKENAATELWLQTTMSMPQAHKLYYKLGFEDQNAPEQMDVLERTEKIMCLSL